MRSSVIDFNEAFIPYFIPSIVGQSHAGPMYIVHGLVIQVHRNIQVTTLTNRYIQFRQGFDC